MFSLVTINYNNVEGLRRTLESVSGQQLSTRFEHIIIDGGSTDGSIDVAIRYASEREGVVFLSEADSGIYNAMNKGFSLATGDYVAFLNSGDVIADQDILEGIFNVLEEDSSIDFLYGDLLVIDKFSNVTRRWIAGPFVRFSLYFGWMSPHPLSFVRRSILVDIGGFDERYRIAADYDLMLRVLRSKELGVFYVNKFLVMMEAGGVSNASFLNVIRSNFEVFSAWRRQGFSLIGLCIFFIKPLSKVSQFMYLRK